MRKAPFTSIASVLAAAASSAVAQTEAPQEDAGTLTEVIVTAQRFTESAQKASIVISVITPEQLQGVTELRQLESVDPGISLATAGGTVQTFIRGTGSINTTALQGTSVAYNADGVAIYTPTMVTPLMYDLERIEVLKGPQGTLYGRNASSGAVNIITKGASLTETEGYVEAEVGDFDLWRGAAAVNVPLSSTFAIRVAAQRANRDGYLSDGTDDHDVTAGRVRMLWEPSAAVSVQAGIDGASVDRVGPGGTIRANPTGDDRIGALDPRLATIPTGLQFPAPQTFAPTARPPYDPEYDADEWSGFAQVDVDVGFATLTVLPGYRYEKLRYREYAPGYEDDQQPESKQSSFEARLANRGDALRWVLGGYYFDLDQSLPVHIRNEANFQNAFVDYSQATSSYAGFGEATFSVTERFRVIGGLRYTHEETDSTGRSNAVLGPPNLPPQTAVYNPFDPVTNPTGDRLDYPIDNATSADATTWRAGAEYDVTAESMLFATMSKGFKGGGTYVDVPGAPQSFKPEFLTAYTLASRNQFLGDTLQVNGEIFYWEIKDQQIPYVGFNSIGQVTYLTANAGKAHMQGANLDVIWIATADVTLHGAVEYNNTEYDSFSRTGPLGAIITPTACSITTTGPNTALGPVSILDCSGQPVIMAPEWTALASYQHNFSLGSAGELLADLGATYGSSRVADLTYAPLMRQDAVTLLNASLTYTSPSRSVTVTGWIRNITDEVVLAGGGQLNSGSGTLPLGFARPALQPPRTFGVSVRYSF